MSNLCGLDAGLHVHIGDDDCVLILKPDGTIDFVMPQLDGDGNQTMPPHAVKAAALCRAGVDDEIYNELLASLIGLTDGDN